MKLYLNRISYFLLICSIILRFLFYYASFTKQGIDNLFFRITPGQDFFQIPNAAYSFLHGGDLQGRLPIGKTPYTNCCGVNTNVYHPVLTLLLGIPLQFFTPWTAYSLWIILHFLTDLFLTIFLIKRFKKHRFLIPSLIIFLASSFAFYEINLNQYHFILTLPTFLLLYNLSLSRNSFLTGFYYVTGLIVKPIGLLWFCPFLFKKYFKTAVFGMGFFILISLPFLFIPIGKYYFDYLHNQIANNSYSGWDIFKLLEQMGIYLKPILYIKILIAVFLLIFGYFSRIKIIPLTIIWILYQLIFYQSAFPYHHSILAPLLALGILRNEIKFDKIFALVMLWITLPAPLFLSQYAPQSENLQQIIFLSWSLTGEILLLVLLLIQPNISILKKLVYHETDS